MQETRAAASPPAEVLGLAASAAAASTAEALRPPRGRSRSNVFAAAEQDAAAETGRRSIRAGRAASADACGFPAALTV